MSEPQYPRLPDEFVNKLMDDMENLAVIHAADKANMKALEKREKIVVAKLLREAMDTGSRATAAKDLVYGDPRYEAWLDEFKAAVLSEATSGADLDRSKLLHDSWRTCSADARRG